MKLNLKRIKVKELQEFRAICAEFINDGVTDLSSVDAQIESEIKFRIASQEVFMSNEAKERAKERKKAEENLTEEEIRLHLPPKTTVDTCPQCGSKDWRVGNVPPPDKKTFTVPEAEWYEGCAKCRYSRFLEVV